MLLLFSHQAISSEKLTNKKQQNLSKDYHKKETSISCCIIVACFICIRIDFVRVGLKTKVINWVEKKYFLHHLDLMHQIDKKSFHPDDAFRSKPILYISLLIQIVIKTFKKLSLIISFVLYVGVSWEGFKSFPELSSYSSTRWRFCPTLRTFSYVHIRGAFQCEKHAWLSASQWEIYQSRL